MKKIPTLFKRVFDNHKVVSVLPETAEGLSLADLGDATVKMDGSCCAIINGYFYVRYDAKKGKAVPAKAIKCQEEPDPVTGHLPCWIPCDPTNPAHKWFVEALRNAIIYEQGQPLKDGTYEAIGPHFQGNPHKTDMDTLYKHGSCIVSVTKTFEGIKEWLQTHDQEGLVFWKDGKPQCKIKRTDFGFEWPIKIKEEK